MHNWLALIMLLTLGGFSALLEAAPVEVVYTGESCDCPTQLGYQLNVPQPPKPKKYTNADYGYRVDKPVQTKTKISYSFDFTVEQPRTPKPVKTPDSKLYAKVDRVTVNKKDCSSKHLSGYSCSSCSSPKARYVASGKSPNAIRRRRDLNRTPAALLRKRLQLQERPTRYVKLYHKDLVALQQKEKQSRGAQPTKTKRKTKKTPSFWQGHRLKKRDIKGEFDLLEQERRQIDYQAPEIIQFMPETLNPDFKPTPCQMGCGAITAESPPPAAEEQEPVNTDQPPGQLNSIPAKRAALNYYAPQQLDFPSALEDYKYVDDSQLRSLLSTTSVRDPLEQSATPFQFAGDLESQARRSSCSSQPLLATGVGYPIEHVSDSQLDSIISGIVYQHPDYYQPKTHYTGALVDPEPDQKKQTTEFLKKLINGRLGGWGFEAVPEPEQLLQADYATKPAKTYGYKSHKQNGYSVDTYSVPPITDYLKAWF